MHPEESTPGPSGVASAAHRRRVVLSDSEDDAVSQRSSDDACESDSSTSSSSGGRLLCCICLNKLSRHEVASPELCDHLFCIICLQSWAEGKKEATCPIDRHPFTLIKVRSIDSSNVLRTLPVTTPRAPPAGVDPDFPVYTEDEFNTYCEVCRECDREAAMLLCDSCDCGYHMDCLQPALEVVPVEEWFCPTCSLIVETGPPQAPNEETSRSKPLSREARSRSASGTRRRGGRSRPDEVRVLPRTREVERVRKRVRRLRETRADKRDAGAGKKRKSKKERDAAKKEASEKKDRFASSIIPPLLMARDEEDIDALYSEDRHADEFLERSSKDENKLSVSAAAKIFRGTLSVPRPTYCGRSKIEERVETCSSAASAGLLDVLLDSQSTLLNRQVDINEDRKLVARGKKRELVDSDDESLRCMKRPLPSVRGELEQLKQKNGDDGCSENSDERVKVFGQDERGLNDSIEKDEKEAARSKENMQADKIGEFRRNDRFEYSRRCHDRSSNSYTKNDYHRRDFYSRSRNSRQGYSSEHRGRRSPHDRRDYRSHDNYSESSRSGEKTRLHSRERSTGRQDRNDDIKHKSARSGDYRHHSSKIWGFGRPSSSDDRRKVEIEPSQVPQESDSAKHSQHTMTLPKTLQFLTSKKSVANANEGAKDAAVTTGSSKPPNGKISKLIELFGYDADTDDENGPGLANTNQSGSKSPGKKDFRKTNDKSLIKSSKDKSPLSSCSHASSFSDSDRERSSHDEGESSSAKIAKHKNDSSSSSRNNSIIAAAHNPLDGMPRTQPNSNKLDVSSKSHALLGTSGQPAIGTITASVSSHESSSFSRTSDSADACISRGINSCTPLKNGHKEACSPAVSNSEEVKRQNSTNVSKDAPDQLCSTAKLNPREAARMQRSNLQKTPSASLPVFSCVKKAPSCEAALPEQEAKNKDKLLRDDRICPPSGSAAKSVSHTSPPPTGAVPLDKGSVAAVVKKRLDPAFQAKEICKQSYKEIVSKCVHKIIEKDTGTQVPVSKIIELVEKYLEFYQHKERKDKKVVEAKMLPANSDV